jgi:hypothetical protein
MSLDESVGMVGLLRFGAGARIFQPNHFSDLAGFGGRDERRNPEYSFFPRNSAILGNGVTVARLTLDQLVMVQIHVPQLIGNPAKTSVCGVFYFQTIASNLSIGTLSGHFF